MSRTKPIIFALLAIGMCSLPAAQAQRGDNPNLRHFYMGRQQVQVIDDSPIIMHKPGEPGGAATMNGSLPNRPMPLPAAGWQSYTPSQPPGFATGLPKTANGVPPKPVQKGPAGNKAKAGALVAGNKSKAKPATAASSPTAVSAYKPYATYKPAQGVPGAAGGNNQQTSTKVQGSILHWARGPHRTY